MEVYPPERTRNVVLAGHNGSGKTTLAESLLFASGAITRTGRVEEGSTTSDFEPEEAKRGGSISLSLLALEHSGTKVNLLDSPGFADFTGELVAGVHAADSVLVAVSAVEGVQVQTEEAWLAAKEAGLPRAVVITKLDRERASFSRTMQELEKHLSRGCIPLQLPIGEEASFRGVVDLLSFQAFEYSGARRTTIPIPPELEGPAREARERLTEAAAEADDELLERYLEGEELGAEQVAAAVVKGFSQGNLVPVFVTSALRLVGVDLLLDAMVRIFPSPLARPLPEGYPQPDPEGPLAAFVFKTVSDPYVGRINLFRVFSGRVRPDTTIQNATRGKEERVGQVFTLRGKTQITLAEVPAGDIGAVAKLSETQTGDFLGRVALPRPRPAYPEPVFPLAIEPKSRGDEDKLSTGLARLSAEDPCIKVERRAETHETVVWGLGDTHLEVLVERLKRKFGVDVTARTPRIPYRETVKGTAQAQGRYVKQTGGRGQYGIAWLQVEPLPRGAGFEFVDRIVGGVIPNQFIPSVEKGVRNALAEGVLAGYPVTDVRVILYDGKHHPVDSSDIAFQLAGSLGFKEAARQAGLVLLEPIYLLEVEVPEALTGDVMGDLNSRRARIQGMEPVGAGVQRIRALVPLAEIQRYAVELRSVTGGRGRFRATFDHYEEVPAHIAQKVVEESKRLAEEAKK